MLTLHVLCLSLGNRAGRAPANVAQTAYLRLPAGTPEFAPYTYTRRTRALMEDKML